jgi:hypothetical protein
MHPTPPQQKRRRPDDIHVKLVVQAPRAKTSDDDRRQNARQNEIRRHLARDAGLDVLGRRLDETFQ